MANPVPDRSGRNTFRNPAVEAAAKAGSIKATSKPKRQPSALSKKIAKAMYPKGIPNLPKKGK